MSHEYGDSGPLSSTQRDLLTRTVAMAARTAYSSGGFFFTKCLCEIDSVGQDSQWGLRNLA